MDRSEWEWEEFVRSGNILSECVELLNLRRLQVVTRNSSVSIVDKV
jgi:hypothetical protein